MFTSIGFFCCIMISSHQMSEMERQSALAFLYNIQANTLTARPCDLYDISYSLLLQMFSVVVAYSVIILQSAWLLVCWSDMVLCRPAFKYKTNQCQMEYIIHGGTITVTRIFISDFHLSFNKILFIFFSDGAVLPPVGGGLGGLGWTPTPSLITVSPRSATVHGISTRYPWTITYP